MHDTLIDEFGGAPGVRDDGALASAIMRPQLGYYDTLIEEAAALTRALPTITPSWTATNELHSGPPTSSEHNLRATPELGACGMLALMAQCCHACTNYYKGRTGGSSRRACLACRAPTPVDAGVPPLRVGTYRVETLHQCLAPRRSSAERSGGNSHPIFQHLEGS